MLREEDSGAARLVSLREIEAIEKTVGAEVPNATDVTLQNLMLVKAKDLAAERMPRKK